MTHQPFPWKRDQHGATVDAHGEKIELRSASILMSGPPAVTEIAEGNQQIFTAAPQMIDLLERFCLWFGEDPSAHSERDDPRNNVYVIAGEARKLLKGLGMSTNNTRHEVVREFQNGQYARSGAFYSSGTELFTYNVKLAWRDKDGTVYFTGAMNHQFSTTSSAHQGAVREVLGDLEVKEQ